MLSLFIKSGKWTSDVFYLSTFFLVMKYAVSIPNLLISVVSIPNLLIPVVSIPLLLRSVLSIPNLLHDICRVFSYLI